jgi:hypothetical protein
LRFYKRVLARDSITKLIQKGVKLPEWVFDYDCAQVGYHPKDNRIVFYDFAS